MTYTFPKAGEYAPFYASYIALIQPDVDIWAQMASNQTALYHLLKTAGDERLTYRYADDKWTLGESIVHMMDTERVFEYRILRISRGDKTPLPGFEQNDYVPNSHADGRTVEDLLDEYDTVRRATMSLCKTFDNATWQRIGTASNNPISVRALLAIIAGHEAHHLRIIAENYVS